MTTAGRSGVAAANVPGYIGTVPTDQGNRSNKTIQLSQMIIGCRAERGVGHWLPSPHDPLGADHSTILGLSGGQSGVLVRRSESVSEVDPLDALLLRGDRSPAA